MLSLILLFSSCNELSINKSVVNYSDKDVFINATYTVAGRMKTPEYVRAENYEEFQFTYIFAAPKWELEDFDMSQDEINKKYIDNWNYKDHKGYQYVDDVIANIHKNENNKILCSFQGEQFIEIASNPERRQKFAKMMAQFVKKHDYDGIELDWEHTVVIEHHTAFIKDIRTSLTELDLGKELYVSSALHSFHKYTQEQADELSEYIDWINIMTYDMGGGIWGNTATHNTPLDLMKKHLENWNVFSPKKICIGLATYGFYYKDILPNQKITEGEKLNKYGRYYSYIELPALFERGWVEKWDDKAEAPYYFSPDSTEFITMDSKRSLKIKMDWILKSGYKGVFWWEFHTDWIPPTVENERGEHILMDYVTDIINVNTNMSNN